MAEQYVYIDGNFVPRSKASISVFDHGFLYGDGVFEGIRAYNGYVFKLKEHIDRLYASARTIMLNIPMTKEELSRAVVETLKKNSLKDAYVRLIVTRGEGDLGLDPRKCKKPSVIIIAGSITLLPKEVCERGIRTIISWVRRDPVDGTSHEVKSLNYLNSILAKLDANAYNADFAVYQYGAGIDHAPFIVHVLPNSAEIDPIEIVRAGRLSHTVRKKFVLATFDEAQKKTVYYMFDWWKA